MILSLKEIKKLLIEKYDKDSWWVAVNGNVKDDTYSLLEIHNIVDDNKDAKVSVIHEEDSASEVWIHIEESNHNLPPIPTEEIDDQEEVSHTPKKKGLTFSPFGKKIIPAKKEADNEAVAAPSPSSGLQDTGSQQAAPLANSKEIEELLAELKQMKSEFLEGIKELKELKESLEEREDFIMASEEKLMEKVHEQEHRSIELDQRAEDIHHQEEALKAKDLS